MGHYFRDCPFNVHVPRPRAEPAQKLQGPRHNPNISPLNAGSDPKGSADRIGETLTVKAIVEELMTGELRRCCRSC